MGCYFSEKHYVDDIIQAKEVSIILNPTFEIKKHYVCMIEGLSSSSNFKIACFFSTPHKSKDDVIMTLLSI